jgi:hypothetical protein
MKTASIRSWLVCAMLALAAGRAMPFDFGAVLANTIEAENKYFSYSSALTPWLSWDGGNGLSAYLSGMVSIKYENFSGAGGGLRKPAVLPELTRFYFSYNDGARYAAELGRVEYTDLLGLTASGLFDGVRLHVALTDKINISGGTFYTGFLFKETAKILMTDADIRDYAQRSGGFVDYGASKRMISFIRLDIPFMDYNNFFFEFINQSDMNISGETLHSQYAQALFKIFNEMNMRIRGGAVVELMENDGGTRGQALGCAFAALASVEADIPRLANNSVKLGFKYSSGPWQGKFTGFTPLNSIAQGMVFKGVFSGLWQLRLDYEIRLLPSLYGDASASLLGKTYNGDPAGNFYGGEVWASFAWRPFDYVKANLGAGFFAPGTVKTYPGSGGVLFKLEAGVMVSF